MYAQELHYDEPEKIAEILMGPRDIYHNAINSDKFMVNENKDVLELSIIFKALISFLDSEGLQVDNIKLLLTNIITSQVNKEYRINAKGEIEPKLLRPNLSKVKPTKKYTIMNENPLKRVLMLDHETQSNIAYIYKKLFNVDSSYYNHIIKSIPPIKLSPLLLEAFIFLKYLEIKDSHNNQKCENMSIYYNNHMDIFKLTQLKTVKNSLLMEAKEPFKSIESQAGLLITLWAVPHSCEDFSVTWDALGITGLLSISNGIFNNNQLDEQTKVGILKRILSEDFKQSYYKICFSIFKDILSKKVIELDKQNLSYNYYLSHADEFYANYIKLASGPVNSKDWDSVEEIPDSWLSLL